MSREIDEKTLAAAKEKLACKIEPAVYADPGSAGSSLHAADRGSGNHASLQPDFIGPDGRVYLTRMTSAGG